MRRAAELAVQEINAAGGVRGRQIELIALDDSARAEPAVAVARQFTEDPTVVAVVGHLTSGATMAAMPVYSGATPVPVISPHQTDAKAQSKRDSLTSPRMSGTAWSRPASIRSCLLRSSWLSLLE